MNPTGMPTGGNQSHPVDGILHQSVSKRLPPRSEASPGPAARSNALSEGESCGPPHHHCPSSSSHLRSGGFALRSSRCYRSFQSGHRLVDHVVRLCGVHGETNAAATRQVRMSEWCATKSRLWRLSKAQQCTAANLGLGKRCCSGVYRAIVTATPSCEPSQSVTR